MFYDEFEKLRLCGFNWLHLCSRTWWWDIVKSKITWGMCERFRSLAWFFSGNPSCCDSYFVWPIHHSNWWERFYPRITILFLYAIGTGNDYSKIHFSNAFELHHCWHYFMFSVWSKKVLFVLFHLYLFKCIRKIRMSKIIDRIIEAHKHTHTSKTTGNIPIISEEIFALSIFT